MALQGCIGVVRRQAARDCAAHRLMDEQSLAATNGSAPSRSIVSRGAMSGVDRGKLADVIGVEGNPSRMFDP